MCAATHTIGAALSRAESALGAHLWPGNAHDS